jgi:hypothetical protein
VNRYASEPALPKCRRNSVDGRRINYGAEPRKRPIGLDPQTQGDARTKKHADVCNGYLPTELANDEERKMGCAECCDCGCHVTCTNPDGSERDDAEALRTEIRRLNLEIAVILEMKKNGQQN